eukprot:551241-Rhodomonas_salina.1
MPEEARQILGRRICSGRGLNTRMRRKAAREENIGRKRRMRIPRIRRRSGMKRRRRSQCSRRRRSRRSSRN